MKQFIVTLLWIFSASFLFAQVDKAKEYLKVNKLAEAKATIDAVVKDPKFQAVAQAWYTKAKVYVAIAKDATLSKQFPSARLDAFEALKKYLAHDDRMLVSLQIDGYKPINDIYTGFYQEAAVSFNDKAYAKSLEQFTNAIMVSKLMNEKGWIKMPLDTNSVLYAGVAAEKLNRYDDAVKYYGQLVDARAKGEGFVEIYKWVANHYFEKKNNERANHFITIGKEVYPSDPFWASLELDMTRDKGDKDGLFATYERTIAANPSNHLYMYNYAVELYQHAYNTDATKRPANSDELIDKAAEYLNRALTIKPGYTKAQLFAGQLQYNRGVDLLNKAKAIKGTMPEDVKAKDEWKTAAMKKFDVALPFFLTVSQLLEPQGKLKAEDKSDLKEAYDLMITIYDQKKMSDTVKEYEVKFNEVDKKH